MTPIHKSQMHNRKFMAIASIIALSTIMLSTSLASAEEDSIHATDSPNIIDHAMVLKISGTFGQLSEDEVEQLQMKGYKVIEHNLTGTSVQLPVLGHSAEIQRHTTQ